MPQHLKIEVGSKLVACLSTSNKADTVYDVTWRIPEIKTEMSLTDVDTGVQRQPQEAEACAKDFKDDFTHARRCIAAAFASSDKLLKHLREHGPPEPKKMKPIIMRLMTNNFDRGFIEVHPSDNESVNVKVLIGVGENRVPDSLPKNEWEWTCEGIDVSGTGLHTVRALTVLRSIGQTLLRALSSEKGRTNKTV